MKDQLLNIAENISILAKQTTLNINLSLDGWPAAFSVVGGATALAWVWTSYDTNRTKLQMTNFVNKEEN